MNVIGGVTDADQELEYVLEVPVDHATTLQDKLLQTGVPERCIRVARPSPHAQFSESDTGLEPNDYNNKPSRAKPFTRFLPGAIKLGTYAEGLYNVTIRRRPLPESRETVCISLSSPSAAEDVAAVEVVPAEKTVKPGQDDQLQSVKQSRTCIVGVGGGSGVGGDGYVNGQPVTIPTCHCDGNECQNYRTRVCEYFANSGTNYTDVCGATDCVHKQIVDALRLTECSSTDNIAPAETTPAPTAVTIEPVKDVVPAQPKTKVDAGPKTCPVCPACPACPASPVCPASPACPACPVCPASPACPKGDTVCNCKTATRQEDLKNLDMSLRTAKINPRIPQE